MNVKDVVVQGQGIFALHFPVYMKWSNMRQTSSVSQNFEETGLGNIFSTGNYFSCAITYLNREISATLPKRNRP